MAWGKTENKQGLRVIKTARGVKSINEATKNGFKPLVKAVQPSQDIKNKFAVLQHRMTGEVVAISDRREELLDNVEYQLVVDWTFFYPYNFHSPIAAYLVPGDLKIGEVVFLEDLIEDYIGASWNQGDTYRLLSCEAVWDGHSFQIQYSPKSSSKVFIG